MREKKKRLHLDSQERSILLQSLVEMKKRLLKQGRYTDCVDDVILKLINVYVFDMGCFSDYNIYSTQ